MKKNVLNKFTNMTPSLRRVNKVAKANLAPLFMSVCPSVRSSDRPSVRMDQIGSHWMNISEMGVTKICLENISLANIRQK
jgi:hypothetical protein